MPPTSAADQPDQPGTADATIAHLRRELADAQARAASYRAVLETVNASLFALDATGRFTLSEGGLLASVGLRPGERVGQRLIELYGEQSETARAVRRALGGEAVMMRTTRHGRTFDSWLTPLRDEAGRVTGVSGVALDITHHARAERALERAKAAAEELARVRQGQVEEAEALTAVTAALSSSLEPAQLYRLIIDLVARVLPCDNACIFLLEDNGAVVAATWGQPNLAVGTRAYSMDDWARQPWPKAGDPPLYVPDTHRVEGWAPIAPWVGEHEVRSTIAVPVAIDGELLGCLAVTSTRPDFYAERHIRVAAIFGERATQAVRNARLYQAEQERRRAAEELARLREDFVASVSHELRTPLTAIAGFAELLEAHWERLDQARGREQLGRIILAANRQKRLVEDLLLTVRLDERPLAARAQVVPIAPLVRGAVGELQGSYLGQRIDLDGPEELRAVGDPDRIVQILANLLDNAAKYSPDGAPIGLGWRREGDAAVVRVRDLGPGIADEDRARLFTRFGRLPGSLIRAGHVGTGLGLYLGRELARAMGGELDLEATGPQGSTFRLRLPAAPEASAVPAGHVAPE